MEKPDAIARIFDASIKDPFGKLPREFARWSGHEIPVLDRRISGLPFVVPRWPDSAKDIPLPILIYRAATNYLTASCSTRDSLVFSGDIIRTSPWATVSFESFDGVRIGVKRSSTVRIGSVYDEATSLHYTDVQAWRSGVFWSGIHLEKGGVFAKFEKTERPLTVTRRGGVMGGLKG